TTAAAEDVCALPSAHANAKIEDLSWLAGHWLETKNGLDVREHWMAPHGGVLLGVGLTTKGNETKSFEFFRVAKTPIGLSYFASPHGAPATEFKAVEICADKIVFENKAHDFPQRVIYARGKNGTLDARIEGTIKGKLEGEDWHYKTER
ncbi:MAG: DUF6265 family protein, partial [Alphaproteobacteria bacterium]|nr:DUF6265 family protein [Alphaproteobacteria bacterium]